ncbi:hypothetical protein AB0C28_54900 [Nonomuraea sp. NPDC048892]|uniref:hypothetical protein n=1 Tax=Nonomuraea sp. NPDC048892 TaxID=3154624 RepID=UPI003406F0BF
MRRGTETNSQLVGRVRAFTGDDRLIKTLLLSALAPTVPALHNLTASRLAALNHGSVTSPIPGGEVGQVARKVEGWAAQFNEIKYVKGDDPGVGLELEGIDVDSIIENARQAGADNMGTRKNLIRTLLYKEFGVVETNQYGGDRFDFTWRGSKRSLEVIFGNVRDKVELDDEVFKPADPTSWRLIVDYPFDEGEFTPAYDRNRVQRMISEGFEARTLCWVPASLAAERIQDLRRLVTIDYALHGQRFDSLARDLNPGDRERARQTLSGQRDVLAGKLIGTLRAAYGLTTKHESEVVPDFDDHLLSLSEGLRPRLLSGASLHDALASLAEQMLKCQFPGHPDFDPDRAGAASVVKPAEARIVLDYIRKAVETSDGRVEVEKAHRITVRRIANPLLLGEMHEAAFVAGSHWRQHFHQRIAQDKVNGDVLVTDLLRWIDEPQQRGLDRLVANLVLACFAEQTDRSWIQYGGPVTPELTQIRDDMKLREEKLPDEDVWVKARQRAMDIFGHNPPVARRARLAALFARTLSDDARKYRDAAHDLVARLETYAEPLGLDVRAGDGRLHTARRAADLLDGLGSHHGKLDIIDQLATADLGGPTQRTGKSIKSATAVADALRGARWDTFSLIKGLREPYQSKAVQIFADLRKAAVADELTLPLGPALSRAGTAAADLLREATQDPTPPPPPPPPPPGDVVVHSVPVSVMEEKLQELQSYAQELVAKNPHATVEITLKVIHKS